MAETLTESVLLDGVAANLDLESTDLTTTVESAVKQWAIEGLHFLAQVAADYAVESYLSTTVAATNPITFPSDALKVIRVVTSDNDEAKYVKPSKLTAVKNLFAGGTNSYKAGQQIWSVVNGKVEVFRHSGNITAHYVPTQSWGSTQWCKHVETAVDYYYRCINTHYGDATFEPQDGENWELVWGGRTTTEPSAWTLWAAEEDFTTSSITIPTGWTGLVVDYATVKAKMKDEESQQAQQLWQMFMQGLVRFRGFEDLKATVGG